MATPKLYLTGGMLRDHVMLGNSGVTAVLYPDRSKDFDFAVEADSFAAMREYLVFARGLVVWQERPEFVTLRGRVDLTKFGSFGGLLRGKNGMVDADFTLCRAEAMYSDKRHPDVVTPAPLSVDLSRRDFTVNAMAMSEDGDLVDPFGGTLDSHKCLLRCVGDPQVRFLEDPLRVLRALRFAVKYAMGVEYETMRAANACALHVATLPVERVREELSKAFKADWFRTAQALTDMSAFHRVGVAVARNFPDLWLKATVEAK
jgi:tRNA nucleotidyltransferase/poly(A) polymerase